MKKFTSFLLLFYSILFIHEIITAQGECVIVVQGARDKPDDDFIKNSVDLFVTGMGATSPAPTITVLRPTGEGGAGTNYGNKEDLKKKIKEALCNEKCKDVVIALIGHGMGGPDGNSIVNPPADKNAGGMKIGAGNMQDDILSAPDVAALIDSCKKSVKLIASQCFAESMSNGICAIILNKGLIGVAIGSSLWNEVSKATGTKPGDMTYDFLINFLKDYYLIIGNPNAMEDIRKAAEDLKKKNEDYNKKVAEENKVREQQIIDCKKKLDELKKMLESLDKQIKETNQKIADAEASIPLLKNRIELENMLATEKDKKKQNMLKEDLKKNTEDLKKVGVTKLPSGGKLEKRIEELNKLIDAQTALLKSLKEALEKLNDDWKKKNGEVVDKEFELDKINNTPPKSPIPNHLPIEELIIHEAFKSAKSMTKTSTGVEPVTPSSTGPVDMPKTPPTKIKIKDNCFMFYKVIDKKTKKCVVVGYRADKNGNPIGPIKSIDCEIDCSKIKFSYSENGTDKVVEATRQTDNSYKFTLDGLQVSNVAPGYKKLDLILPGQLLEEAYFAILFNTIPDVVVPHCQVIQPEYDAELSQLHFILLKGNRTHQVFLEFMPHEDVMITIDQSAPYLSSSTRRYTLLDQSSLSNGKLGIIVNEDQLNGNVTLCVDDDPLAISGQFASDLYRFILSGQDISHSFQLSPLQNNNSLMVYNYDGHGGIIHQDIQNEPFITSTQLLMSQSGHNLLHWQFNNAHLSDVENEMFASWTIVAYEQPNLFRSYSIPKNQNTWEDPFPIPQQTMLYKIYPVVANNVYSQAYQGVLYDEFGLPTCISNPGNQTLISTNRKRTLEKSSEAIIVYPNPFNQSTELHFTLESEQQIQLRIFNVAGNLIDQRKINVSKGWNTLTISKDALKNAGIYFYDLQTRDRLFRGKLIFQL